MYLRTSGRLFALPPPHTYAGHSLPIDIQEQADPHFRRIHRTQFNLRIAVALGCDIAAAFHNILLREPILCSICSCDLPRPVILPGVPQRLQLGNAQMIEPSQNQRKKQHREQFGFVCQSFSTFQKSTSRSINSDQPL